MYVGRPIHFPEHRPTQEPSERGFIVVVALFTLLALSGSVWLSLHGVSVFPCGEDPVAACDLL